MADIILNFVVERLLSKVVSLAAEQICLVRGLNKELSKLRASLTMVRGVLEDAEKKQVRNESVKLWLRKLKVVAYAAEDVLDELGYELLRQKVGTQNQIMRKVVDFCSHSNPIAFRLHMAREVEKINESLNEIKSEVAGFGLIGGSVGTIPQIGQSRLTDSLLNDSDVFIGRDADVSEALSFLTGYSNQVISVVAVVGMPGLGKTTLTQMVLKEVKQRNLFDIAIWVCVSDNFDELRILNGMLQTLDQTAGGLDHMDAVLQHLKKSLENKKFVLVLDDVWNEESEKWESLKRRLLNISGSTGNVVVVTTRSEKAGSIMLENSPGWMYKPKGLSTEECWSIIKIKVFGRDRKLIPSDMEVIGREIAEECGGVPLAARVIGGMMCSKRNKEDWLSIAEMLSNGHRNISDAPEFMEGVLPILKLSFDHLPPSLKHCFAYCSVFPKDFEIDREHLIQLWMAQGFLERSDGATMEMEDVGNAHFDYLLLNSFFQDAERDKFQNVTTCKMHDLLHDLALLVSKSETLILTDGAIIDDAAHIYHLTVYRDGKLAETFLKDGSTKLRSLFSEVNVLDKNCNFGRLRTLNLSGAGVRDLPTSIGMLKHLRLLDVSGNYIDALPKSVTKLYYLQTLRLEGCGRLKRFPRKMRNLTRLRHIYFSYDFQMPVEVGRLICLRTLPIFAVGAERGSKIEELECLNELRGKLAIVSLELVRDKKEAEKANLHQKGNLKALKLRWSSPRRERWDNDEEVLEGLQPHLNMESLKIENYGGKKFPLWVLMMKIPSPGTQDDYLPLDNLVRLTLMSCTRCKEIPRLGHLPHLRVLDIRGMDGVEYIGSEFYGVSRRRNGGGEEEVIIGTPLFPALEEFRLSEMGSLKEWRGLAPAVGGSGERYAGVFPSLKELSIDGCPELTTIPVIHLSALVELEIRECDALSYLCDDDQVRVLFPALQLLYLHGMGSLVEWMRSYHVDEGGVKSAVVLFPSLKNLFIRRCQQLMRIENISCLSALVELNIGNCDELRYSSAHGDNQVLHAFKSTSLEELLITGCGNLVSIPSVENLSSLKTVKIANCDKLASLPSGLQSCTSLKELVVRELKSLVRIENISSLSAHVKLKIENCDELRYLSTHGDNQVLHGFKSTSLEELLITGCGNLVSIRSLDNLSSLKTVTISNCDKLASIPSGLQSCTSLKELILLKLNSLTSFPEDVLPKLHSLVYTEIRRCRSLRYFPEDSFRCLTRLRHLEIGRFSEELEEFPGIDSVRHLHAHLKELRIIGWDKLKSLPHQLQRLTALQSLNISDFNTIEALPEWLGDLSSLRSLYLRNCVNLKYLPEVAMRRLSELHKLSIHNCPKLKERCNKDNGPEWSKISHIPIINEYDACNTRIRWE